MQTRILPLLILGVAFSGCGHRYYKFNDVGRVAVAVNDRPVLPADPAVTSANVGGSTIRRTADAVLIDGHAVLKDRQVTLNTDLMWAGSDHRDQPSRPSGGSLTMNFDHVIASGQTPAGIGTVYKFSEFYNVTITTAADNVRVIDKHGTRPGLGFALVTIGGSALATGLGFSAAGIFDTAALYLNVSGLIGVAGGIALMWPREHERWSSR